MQNTTVKVLLSVILSLAMLTGYAQRRSKKPQPVGVFDGELRISQSENRDSLALGSGFEGLAATNIGPTVMSGRVTDIEVDPNDAMHFYVAYASGGLWETKNNGMSFEPLFDNETVMTIGDIAVNWTSGDIWIGTGENNSSRSSYSGVGMYLSEDQGKSWTWKGLAESHHIGKVICHPTDENTLWVSVLGHLYSSNEERGIYKSTDKGNSWKKVLYVSDTAGGMDMELDPSNPNHLFASTWERQRSAWNFQGSGEGSGIYESTDAGLNWKLISGAESGFPKDEGTGRIGLTIGQDAQGLFLYAMLDNQSRRPEEEKEAEAKLDRRSFENMTKEAFLELTEEDLETFLRENNFPEKHTAAQVKSQVKEDELTASDLYKYLTDANAALFDTPVVGAEVYAFDPKGKTWSKTHDGYLDDVVFSYGYYFGMISCQPEDRSSLYIAGVPMLSSKDAGANWEAINANNVHVDHHVLWVNPNRPGHLINGNDGGINISYDDGENYVKCNSPSVGQFYTVAVDYAKNYKVYGGLQDNGVWVGPHDYEANIGWQQSGRYPYKSIMGGDGMQIAIDKRDNETVYTGYQFGHYYRMNEKTGDYLYIHPKHELGESPLRWNWQTPILLSSHNQDILYMGSNRFHASLDRGENFRSTPDDLTRGGKKGNVPFGTLTSIHESELEFGKLVVGSDDGLVHLTNDGGKNWKKLKGPWPETHWISRVKFSSHELDRIYVTANGYRNDDFKAYAYRSDDNGNTWTDISTHLPSEPVNVILEDAENEDLLFVGTDHGLYVSLDRGNNWALLNHNLPSVAVHDLVIQERERDLLVGTHGRSLFRIPIGELGELNKLDSLHLFNLKNPRFSSGWGDSWSVWIDPYEPEITIPCFVPNGGNLEIRIDQDSLGTLHTLEIEDAFEGLNYFKYDLSISEESAKKLDPKAEAKKNGKFYIPVGKYRLKVLSQDEEFVREWEIVE